MLPINFDILRAEYPEYAAEWKSLREWFTRNWRKRYVELSVLARALPELDRLALVQAIQAMVDNSMLAVAFRVKAPGGYLLEGEFEGLDQIPPELPDRDYSGHVDTAEADVVSGYRWETTDAA